MWAFWPRCQRLRNDPDFALRPIDALADKVKSYYWFHSINLGAGIVTPGIKDPRRHIARGKSDL